MTTVKRRGGAFTVVLALLGLLLLYVAVPQLGPAVRAARADGVTGTFTARELACVQHPGHESCTWTGDFVSDDRRAVRAGIELYGSDRDTLAAGAATRAVDTGRAGRVYGPGGSREWVFTVLIVVVGLATTGGALSRSPWLRRAGR
ncbi:hypothetical protein [Rhizohabitans arisaemae]|uniref:hypothetical protein n=1 Tax=Rhizohabitans arisaemae TaxID=2720610 RepID=UPI0024B10C44|nr:hypothetical protein [Rhizohabitans arisaemae]